MKKGYLVLQNGSVFEGERFGAEGEIRAELVFTTGMVGYLETLTDPSYHGQMVVQTFPLIGNYGVIPEDFESRAPRLSAYIVREAEGNPSNFRCRGPLGDYLLKSGVIGLKSIDTRALTRILREAGEMNAAILDELPIDMEGFTQELAACSLSSDVYQVGAKEVLTLGSGDRHAVLWDFGAKDAMAQALTARGCRVTVVPPGTAAGDIIAMRPDGVLLSNGPGDPADNTEIIAEIKRLAQSGIPIMGICLGHQMLALARGGARIKLKYGHRGGNQPARRTCDGRLFITSQNHSYALTRDQLPEGARVAYENVNDQTIEGLDYDDIPAFSVQFHPEACAGPKDTGFLFDQFIQMMED